jgi:hypothetical protein
MSAADALDAVQADLPPEVRAHPGLAAIRAHLARLDPEAALYHLYIEWNPLKSSVDPSFVLPTRAFGAIKLPLADVAEQITAGLPHTRGPGAALLAEACRRFSARAVDDPLYPRAFSVSLEGLEHGGAHADVALVFSDLGPPLDLGARPEGVREAFADLPSEDPDVDRNLTCLTSVARGLRLDHVGLGRRRGRVVHKVYLGGTLGPLTQRLLEPATAGLVGPHAEALRALAERAGPRPAAMVVDAAGGVIRRAGFELNLDVRPDENPGYADAVFGSALWALAPEGLRATEAFTRGGAVRRDLGDGHDAVLESSHVKLSFDGSARPEWKLYLRLQKAPGTRMKDLSAGAR